MLTSLAKISQILAHFHVCILAHFHTPLILLSCYLSGLVIVLIDQHWSWQYLSSFMKKTSFLWNLCSLSLTDWIYKQKCSPKITNKKSSGFNGVFPRPTCTQIHLEPEKRSQAADSSGMTIFSYWGSRSHTRFASKKYKFQAVQPLSKAHGTLIKSADVINALLINWSIKYLSTRGSYRRFFLDKKINNSVSVKLLHLLWGIWKCNFKNLPITAKKDLWVCLYFIKCALLAQNGQNGAKTDFRGPRMPPIGASWT